MDSFGRNKDFRIMIEKKHIIKIQISNYHIKIIHRYAELLCIGGKSQLRKNRRDRMDNLLLDQIVGQVGQFALCWWKDGCDKEFLNTAYYQSFFKDRNGSDGGHDIARAQVDIKTSMARIEGRDLLDYNLIVAPKEYRENWTYVFGLVKPFNPAQFLKLDNIECHLIGWKSSNDMTIQNSGMFAGNFVTPAHELEPLIPLKYLE